MGARTVHWPWAMAAEIEANNRKKRHSNEIMCVKILSRKFAARITHRASCITHLASRLVPRMWNRSTYWVVCTTLRRLPGAAREEGCTGGELRLIRAQDRSGV